MVMFCMCFALSPVSVSANKKVGMTGGDVDELRHDENEYADVIFKGQVKGETDKQFFYITAVNQKTSERFSFNFSKRNKLLQKENFRLAIMKLKKVEQTMIGQETFLQKI